MNASIEPIHDAANTEYWERRARRFATQEGGLPAVCSYGMPWAWNVVIDWCQRRALAPWLKVGPGTRVLDVGCGVGRWSLKLAARGAQVTGIDVSPFMVEQTARQARDLGLEARFVACDVRAAKFEQRFDRVLTVTVIQHVVQPEEARAALANLAAHLAPDGLLVMLEAAPAADVRRCDSATFRARTFEWYARALSDVGLEVVAVRGVDPLPLKTWLLPYFSRWPRGLRNVVASACAFVSLPFDWLLGPVLARRSWHKVIVARRRADGAP